MWVQHAPFSMPTWVCGKEQRNIKKIKLLPPLHLSLTLWGDFVHTSECVEGRRCIATPCWSQRVWPGNSLYSMYVHTGFSGIKELSGCRYLSTAGLAICFLWKAKTALCHWGTHYLPTLISLQCPATAWSAKSVCWKTRTPSLWRVVPAFCIRSYSLILTSLLLSLLGPSQCLLIALKIILHWENTAPISTGLPSC